jgi:hypothetical protein
LWSSPCFKHIGDGPIKWLLQGKKNCGEWIEATISTQNLLIFHQPSISVARLKMVTNHFKNQLFMWPMERLHMHSRGPDFVLLGLGNFGRDFSFFPCSYHVCNMSSKIPIGAWTCSQ